MNTAKFADRYVTRLIDKGNFTPATTITPRMMDVMSKKHRWGIHYNMDTYDGCCFVDGNSQQPSAFAPPLASTFNIPKIDFNKIVDDAHACHINIAFINAFHETGFNIWPSDIAKSMYTIGDGTHITPYHNQDTYNVRGHADPGIIENFCTVMRKEGIEPWLYVNLSAHWNFFNTMQPVSNLYAYGDNRRAEWVLYVCLLCQELLVKYGPNGLKGLWIDAYTVLNRAEYQKVYNAIKSIDPDCWVTMNMGVSNTFHNFPGDAQSYEGYVINNPSVDQYKNIDSVVDGVTYKIPKEFIISLQTLTNPQLWYDYTDVVRIPAPYPVGQYLPQATLQGLYNAAMSYGCGFMTSPSLTRFGTFRPEQLAALKALTYHL